MLILYIFHSEEFQVYYHGTGDQRQHNKLKLVVTGSGITMVTLKKREVIRNGEVSLLQLQILLRSYLCSYWIGRRLPIPMLPEILLVSVSTLSLHQSRHWGTNWKVATISQWSQKSAGTVKHCLAAMMMLL